MTNSKHPPRCAVRMPSRRVTFILAPAVAGLLLLAACSPGNDAPTVEPTGSVEELTPDVALASARKTIEAVLEGGATFTPPPETPTATATEEATVAVTPTPPPTGTPGPTDTPIPTATATATPLPEPTFTSTATATFMPSPTASPVPTHTPDMGATATSIARQMGTAVAATLTAAVTPTYTPDVQKTIESRAATSVAATLTAQPRPTNTPVPPPSPTATRVPPPTVPPTVPPPIVPPAPPAAGAAQELQARLGSAGISSRFPNEAYAFVGAIGSHINDFQLPGLGITTGTMNDALRRSGSASRVNALISQVWGDWLDDVRENNLNAYSSDPSAAGLSPFRQLLVRLIQGRQGTLVDNQQHGLYNFFTRNEEDHVWYDYVNGVIGAVNRESFLWP